VRSARRSKGPACRTTSSPRQICPPPAENELRRRLLTATRAYESRDGVFGGFPHDVQWEHVVLAREELPGVRYINWHYWVQLSGGSRMPADAARRIREGVTVFGVPNDGFWEAAEHVRDAWPELLLATAGSDEPVVVLEGHVRVTAYVLAGAAAPAEVAALLGTSPRMADWALY
jgi:hypothetical protein